VLQQCKQRSLLELTLEQSQLVPLLSHTVATLYDNITTMSLDTFHYCIYYSLAFPAYIKAPDVA
jgi:hypothetical protein